VKEVAGLLRPITIEIADSERLGACIADVLPSMGDCFHTIRYVGRQLE
jgi:hypothetical protein